MIQISNRDGTFVYENPDVKARQSPAPVTQPTSPTVNDRVSLSSQGKALAAADPSGVKSIAVGEPHPSSPQSSGEIRVGDTYQRPKPQPRTGPETGGKSGIAVGEPNGRVIGDRVDNKDSGWNTIPGQPDNREEPLPFRYGRASKEPQGFADRALQSLLDKRLGVDREKLDKLEQKLQELEDKLQQVNRDASLTQAQKSQQLEQLNQQKEALLEQSQAMTEGHRLTDSEKMDNKADTRNLFGRRISFG